MLSVLKLILSTLYLVFVYNYFLSEYRKDNFKTKNWIAGRGKVYFGLIVITIMALYVIISELINLF